VTKMITVAQVSEMLSVSVKTIYMWCDLRMIPHYKLNGTIRFKAEEIEEWVGSCMRETIDGYNTMAATGSPRKGGPKNGAL
jgi:excisionase family DNA binding protein